jgi:BirA family biotin operon repressor/biotin-[acetyl-CoA-carboxylase] ligase
MHYNVAPCMKAFTPRIIQYETLPSTNTEAARLAIAGAEEGVCVVAKEQTAGRGRLQREWLSPKGAGLYFSIILRPRLEIDQWALMTLMAALAVHDALRAACGLEADIKWPNDVLADEKKLCGILSETFETPEGRAVVVGIGINLTSSAFPPELATVATSVESATGRPPDAELILQSLVATLGSLYTDLHKPAGQREIVARWIKNSSYANGKRVRVSNGDEAIEGTTRGIENDGALRLETFEGAIKVVRAGDVTLLRSL